MTLSTRAVPLSRWQQPSVQTLGARSGASFTARGTGYYPDPSIMEGGYFDRKGKPLKTLQAYLRGAAPYVSVAMDTNAFPYGTRLRIVELERKYGRQIEFRVVDTGGAFKGKGTSRIDICTENQRASVEPTVNGTLHCIVQSAGGGGRSDVDLGGEGGDDGVGRRGGPMNPSTLRLGSRGAAVSAVQKRLGLKETGVYNVQTEAAVRKFQSEKGMEADGWVGPRTAEALGVQLDG